MKSVFFFPFFWWGKVSLCSSHSLGTRPGWLQNQRSTCHFLLNARTNAVQYHALFVANELRSHGHLLPVCFSWHHRNVKLPSVRQSAYILRVSICWFTHHLKHIFQSTAAAQAFNPSTHLRQAWSTKLVPRQSGLHKETLPWKTYKWKNIK